MHKCEDRGLGIEPLEEMASAFAVVEAAVELVTDVPWETGDFADACHGND